jgi:DNA repair protein RadD
VDAVEVLEPGRDGTFGGLCPRGRVFNLEVEGTHTYVAGGFVVHNCHHALATSYQTALDANPDALTIGLSATPWGADGRGLGGLFEELVLVATPAQLLAQGYLVPFDGFSFDVPDLSSVRVRGSDYDEGQLARAVNTSYVVGGIVERWQEHARGVRTVVFTVDIEHSRNIVARFLAAGVPAEHLDGDVPIGERKAILARLKAGETLVVSNCGVLCEGWDMPECACCILARPTQSLVLYLQQAGRVLRLAPGKTRARIHDHAGCLTRFGLPDAERDYSLHSDTRKSAPAEAGVQTCPLCARVFPLSARHCPDCFVPETRGEPGTIVETDGHLVEIAELRLLEELRRIPELLLAKKAAEYLRLKEEAARNGYKPGWAYFRYRETFHEEPKFPRGFLESCRPATRAFGPLDQLALTTGGHTP